MTTQNRIFISFAIEDKSLRDLFIGQAKNKQSPFGFVDMSVKKPWDSSWKTNCRSRIKGCHGMIAIVTGNSKNAEGHLWEIKCAKEEGITILGIWGDYDNKPSTLPTELTNIEKKRWTWPNIENWLETL